MNKSFKCGGAITANGGVLHTSQVFKLYDNTDNATYNASAVNPAVDMMLESIHIVADDACEVQFGYCNAGKTTFTPIWGTLATVAAGGGVVRRFDVDRPLMPFTAAQIPAFRVIVAADATVHVGGDVDLVARNTVS